MADKTPLKIDWDRHYVAIDKYLALGQGALLKVNASPGAPRSAFAKAIRHHITKSNGGRTWVSVQINPADSETHYFVDILYQIARSCGFSFTLPHLVGAEVNVGNDNTATTVSVEQVHIEFHQAHHAATILLDAFIQELKTWLDGHSMCLVFMDSHDYPVAQQRDLLNRLWEGGIANLLDRGILVIDISDLQSGIGSLWPPPADETITLEAVYSLEDKGGARRDIALGAVAAGIYSDDTSAMAFADGILASSTDVRDVHLRTALALSQMARVPE